MSEPVRARGAAVVLVLLIVVVPVAYAVTAPLIELPLALRQEELSWVRVFATVTLAFFPGWLFIRFIKARGPALWDEYVVNLHRLGVDRWEHLPRPPRNSEYYGRWQAARRAAHLPLDDQLHAEDTIYQKKFDAYYGQGVSRALQARRRVHTETLFPVFLLTAVFAVAWTAILYDGSLVSGSPDALGDVLAYGFAGSYLFNLQMLIRRFFQSDLKSSAYASAFTRTVTVLIIVAVLHQLPLVEQLASSEAAAAFIIGFFPLAGLQALRRVASKVLQTAVPSLRSDYPLSELDGLNLWYESRLIEEGIEDIEELVTANLVDVLLHTRVPVARLIDWLDQAHLLLHLPPLTRDSNAAGDTQPDRNAEQQPRQLLRTALRRGGIRTATDLLAAFGVYRPVQRLESDVLGGSRASAQGGRALPAPDPEALALWLVAQGGDNDPVTIHALVAILANEQALTPVLNWREWGTQRMSDLQTGRANGYNAAPGMINGTCSLGPAGPYSLTVRVRPPARNGTS